MAHRFPSLEEFSDGQIESKSSNDLDFDGLDGDDDFLTREKAALGDDAAQFASAGENARRVPRIEADDGDLLGGDDNYESGQYTENGADDLQTSFPAIDTSNEQVAPGGTITGSGQFSRSQPSYSSYEAPGEEPEVVKQWRERRELALQHRAETSAAKKAETIKASQTAIDEFYENYNKKKDKTIAQTRKEAEEYLASREDTSAGGTSWERIAKLVDLSGKGSKGGANGTGKEKFRELLLSLKKDEKAPGASGV